MSKKYVNIAEGDDIELLAQDIAVEHNDSIGIAQLLARVIKNQAWTSKGFTSLRKCIEAPRSKKGLNTTITVVMGHAEAYGNTSLLLRQQAVSEGWYDEIIAKMKAAQAKVKIDAVEPVMTRSARARKATAARMGAHMIKCVYDPERIALNTLRSRVAQPEHPKHAMAKTVMARVLRGEITARTAQRIADQGAVPELTLAKTNTRRLDADARQAFLDWLVKQGAVLAITPNPDFTGFTDGRKKPLDPVA